MADPRQMWENLQKGLARAQQSGQRSVNINNIGRRASKLNHSIGSEVQEEAPQIHEEH